MNTTHNTARRKRPWLSFASVLLALTSFVSAQSNSDLSALVPSAGTLDPVFDSATIDYTAAVPFSTTSITVTPTVAEAGATVTVNGNPVASGNASDPIALSVGANVISTVVTSQDTTTTKTYTLTVTRVVADLVTDFQSTISSQQNADSEGEGRFYHISLISPNPGTGSFCADLAGSGDPAPPFVRNYDGPVEAYRFAGGGDITVATLSGGADIITYSTADTSYDGFGQNNAKVWITTDPGNDIAVGDLLSATADANPSGSRGLGGVVGTIDVSAIAAGSVHIYYADYQGKPTVSLVMRDLDAIEPDLTIANAHLNDDTANGGEHYLAEIDFVTDGIYEQIEFTFDAGSTGDTATGNGRGIGVVVTSAVADAVDPTLAPADIVDNVSGGPFTSTGVDSITYTVTYSELMDPDTIDASDFGFAAGSVSATIDSVVHFGGVTTVVATPTAGTSGTLELQVNATAVLTDLAGNPLDTTSAIVDDTAVTIVADLTPPTLVSITDNVGGGPINEGQSVIYTVTFDEPMKASTIETTDFEDGGSPGGTIDSVAATGDPAVYEVTVSTAYPGGIGTLILQIKSDATLEDLSGNLLVTGGSPIPAATITVNAQEARQTVTVDSWLAIPDPNQDDGANGGIGATMTFDASGSDKLVILVCKENNSTPYTTLTYEGEPLLLAVGRSSTTSTARFDGIYYLDNPGNYDDGDETVGEIVAKSGSSRNILTAVALSNTAPGVGGTAVSPEPWTAKSVDLPLQYIGSAVLAAIGMGQDGNTANPVTSATADLPLLKMTGVKRSSWVGHATAYATSQGPGLNTYGFTTTQNTGINTIAAEFPGALVGSGSPYDTWTGGPFSGTLTDTNPALDFDGGSLETGLEWVLGGDPTLGSDDATIAPTFDNTTDPDFFIFTYRRDDDAAADTNTAIKVEYGSDLAGWTEAVAGADIIITPTDDGAAAGIDLVEVKIRRTLAVGGKLFARLNVVVTTP